MTNSTKCHIDSFIDEAVTLLLANKENQLVFAFFPCYTIIIYRAWKLSLQGAWHGPCLQVCCALFSVACTQRTPAQFIHFPVTSSFSVCFRSNQCFTAHHTFLKDIRTSVRKTLLRVGQRWRETPSATGLLQEKEAWDIWAKFAVCN